MYRIVEDVKERVQDPEQARTTGTFSGFMVFPPVSEIALMDAEKALKLELPALLRHLYFEVGNGGLGPGFGLLGLPGGATFIDHVGDKYGHVSTY